MRQFVCLSRTEWPPERKKERKKKSIQLSQNAKKNLLAGEFFFGKETEICMTQRMSFSPDTNNWLLLNTIGVHWCRHHVQGNLLEDFFLQCFQSTINLLFWKLNVKSYKFNVCFPSKQTLNNWDYYEGGKVLMKDSLLCNYFWQENIFNHMCL